MALSGRNGTGKTTLLRILAGEASADAGRVSLQKGARVVLHDQRPPRELGLTLGEYVEGGLSWVVEIEKRLAELEGRMATDSSEATLTAYADAQARFDTAGGYRWRDEARETVRGLGFEMDELERDLATFSGGELTRASLARALAAKPDLLLLDEPTNHLDIVSLEWLEEALTTMDAAVILVAHDRWFLEAVGNSVLELGDGQAEVLRRPVARVAHREGSARALPGARREEAGGRHRAARAVRRALSRKGFACDARPVEAEADRADQGGAPERDRASKSLSFSFGDAARSGKVVLAMEDATIDAGPKRLFEDAELWVESGEHVCLIGHNGSGKSTLISTLIGDRPPVAGRVKVGHNVELGHLRQHAEMPRRSGTHRRSPMHSADGALRGEDARPPRKFLFSGDDVVKLVTPAFRRRGAAAVAGDPGLVGLERPDPRRADQPPRPREPRGARGRARPLRRHAAPRLARQGDAGGRRHPHGRGRGQEAACVPRRLVGVPRKRARTGLQVPGTRRNAHAAGERHRHAHTGQASAPGPRSGACSGRRRAEARRRDRGGRAEP